jgi:hypothetical protein
MEDYLDTILVNSRNICCYRISFYLGDTRVELFVLNIDLPIK